MMGGANWTAHATLPNHLHKRQTSLRVQKNCESERLLYRNGLDVKREWADVISDSLAYRGKPWQRYITFARVAARREEAEAAERERQERESRRAEFNQAVEASREVRARRARV
jgi:hypothetical protein